MAEILALYPAEEIEIFNAISFTTCFVTVDKLYENIDTDSLIIVLKDNNYLEIINSIRKDFIYMPIAVVTDKKTTQDIDDRTYFITEKKMQKSLEEIIKSSRKALFSNENLQNEVNSIRNVNVDLILWSEKGYWGDIAAEYVCDNTILYKFDLHKDNENHIITQASKLITKKQGSFSCFYITGFDQILTLISLFEWFMKNKSPFVRTIIHIDNGQMYRDIPESFFKNYYTLRIPPLKERLNDILTILNGYDYKIIPKGIIEFISKYDFPENEYELLSILDKAYDKKLKNFEFSG